MFLKNFIKSISGGAVTATNYLQEDGLTKRGMDVNTVGMETSKMMFSEYQATLINGAEIDSGWIDYEHVDKLQFSAKSDTAGLTFESYSRADDLQPILTTSNIIPSTFWLGNTTVRQRYVRVKIINNTGGTVNDASLELKGSYGSSDKLSVFSLNIAPTSFSQAALTQSVIIGQTPGGDYVSAQVNEAGASLVSDFGTEVARGLYSNYSITNRFGRNPDVDTGTAPEDVWGNGGGLYTGFNAIANENIETFSASAADIGSVASSGTATSGSASTLGDSGATFVSDGVVVGDCLVNDSDGTHGFVTSLTETELTLFRMNDGAGAIHVNVVGDTYRVVQSAGTGAAVVRLSSVLDIDDVEQLPIYVVLNGVTGVISTGTYGRCSFGKVVHSGSADLNVGLITARQQTTTANIFVAMPILGQSAMAVDTVPAGKRCVLKNLRAGITKSGGAAGSASIGINIREKFGSWNARETFEIETGNHIDQHFDGGIVLEAGTDFKLTAVSVSSNSTIVDGSLEYFFIDE